MKTEKVYQVEDLNAGTLVEQGPLSVEVKGDCRFGTGSVHWYGSGVVQTPDGKMYRVTGVEGQGSRFKNIAASDGEILIEEISSEISSL